MRHAMTYIFTALLCGLGLLNFGSAAQAGPIIVQTDSGTIGNFSLTSTGGIGGVVHVDFTGTEQLTNVNGSAIVPLAATFTTPVDLTISTSTVMGTLITLDFAANANTKTFTEAGSTAALNYSLAMGQGTTSLPDFFNISGPVTLAANGTVSYDFSQFLTPGAVNNVTLTATSLSGGTSLAAIVANGGSASGSAAFSELSLQAQQGSVPEPSTLLMLTSAAVVGGLYAQRRRLWVKPV